MHLHVFSLVNLFLKIGAIAMGKGKDNFLPPEITVSVKVG
jgi:hypothetical protein